MMYTYTLCFIRHQSDVLMLHRRRPPNQGKWNGVGGKIEPGESPTAACLREIREETGLSLTQASFRGVVTWNGEDGMYVFRANSPTRMVHPSDEGDLAWKSIPWVLESEDVVSNIKVYFAAIEGDEPPLEHAFTYDDQDRIVDYQPRPWPESDERGAVVGTPRLDDLKA